MDDETESNETSIPDPYRFESIDCPTYIACVHVLIASVSDCNLIGLACVCFHLVSVSVCQSVRSVNLEVKRS